MTTDIGRCLRPQGGKDLGRQGEERVVVTNQLITERLCFLGKVTG